MGYATAVKGTSQLPGKAVPKDCAVLPWEVQRVGFRTVQSRNRTYSDSLAVCFAIGVRRELCWCFTARSINTLRIGVFP